MCTSLRLECPETEDKVLRSAIHERLRAGKLPLAPAGTVFATRGADDRLCGACNKPIVAGDIRYEAEWPSGDEQTAARVIVLHSECYDLWDQESTS